MKDPFLAAHQESLKGLYSIWLNEDIREGDHTSQAVLNPEEKGRAELLVKDDGVICGLGLIGLIYKWYDPDLKLHCLIEDGNSIQAGDIAFEVSGSVASILSTERLVLNLLQHLSGIASKTSSMTSLIEDLPTRLLDTRKTTPGLRLLEKWAVRVGGGTNHRMGLYDMIMIKDNHVDAAGSISSAVDNCVGYMEDLGLSLKIEVETRNMDEVSEALSLEPVDWIMLDNFNPDLARKAVQLIGGTKTIEASGGIKAANLRDYAETGVDYISSGSLTQAASALDLSLKIRG